MSPVKKEVFVPTKEERGFYLKTRMNQDTSNLNKQKSTPPLLSQYEGNSEGRKGRKTIILKKCSRKHKDRSRVSHNEKSILHKCVL